MRLFTDPNTRIVYDLSVGRESYGMQVLLFFPRNGGEVLKALLASDTRLEAQAELDGFADAELQACLERAVGWSDSSFAG